MEFFQTAAAALSPPLDDGLGRHHGGCRRDPRSQHTFSPMSRSGSCARGLLGLSGGCDQQLGNEAGPAIHAPVRHLLSGDDLYKRLFGRKLDDQDPVLKFLHLAKHKMLGEPVEDEVSVDGRDARRTHMPERPSIYPPTVGVSCPVLEFQQVHHLHRTLYIAFEKHLEILRCALDLVKYIHNLLLQRKFLIVDATSEHASPALSQDALQPHLSLFYRTRG